MGVYDYFRGPCPHCGGKVDTSPDYGVCGDMQTKICSVFATDEKGNWLCSRDFYPGDTLPILKGENYFGDRIPKTFLWILKGETACCGKRIAIFVKDCIIGEPIKTDDIDFRTLMHPVYIG